MNLKEFDTEDIEIIMSRYQQQLDSLASRHIEYADSELQQEHELQRMYDMHDLEVTIDALKLLLQKVKEIES